jgi:hypothetical protein
VPLVAFFCCASPATHNNNSLSCVWQPAQENTLLSPKTGPLWSLSNSKVSSCC